MLIDNLNESDAPTQVIVLQILTAIFQSPDMKECWCNFVELLTLRVLKTHCDEKREVSHLQTFLEWAINYVCSLLQVVKEAEATAAAMGVCPFNTIISILAPLIRTNPYPFVLGAIKMLTKMIETNPSEVTDEHLAQIMPGLIVVSGVLCSVSPRTL